MHVAIPRCRFGRWNFSFGACIRSSGSAKPISTVGTPSTSPKVRTTAIVPPERTSAGAAPKPAT